LSLTGELFAGVCSAVAAAFPSSAVYDAPVPQGATRDCFFISFRPPSGTDEARRRFAFTKIIGNRYRVHEGLCIEYHPDGGGRAALADVSEKLFTALELVPIADSLPARSKKMYCDIIDGVLYFFAEYEFFAYTEADTDYMEAAEYINLTLPAGNA